MKGGIKRENIILMQYDDLAQNSQNPKPGTVINEDTGPIANKNLYPPATNDYTQSSVNANNMMAVLSGQVDQIQCNGGNCTKRVIQSTENDEVFWAFYNHGGPGILGTPVPPYLQASAVHAAIKHMAEKKMFKKLVIYSNIPFLSLV